MWRIDGAEPVEVAPTALSRERELELEDVLEARPEILGEPLLVIDRQVPTSMGGVVDLVAVDTGGVVQHAA